MNHEIVLRDVQVKDLDAIFRQQADPVAHRMAGFTPRDRQAFLEHWHTNILSAADVAKLAIVVDDTVAGHLVCFMRGGLREVGYWIDRAYWGKGIATWALSSFLQREPRRPLHAVVFRKNHGSRRVLEKCGFRLETERDQEWIFRLDASPATPGSSDGSPP